jgi:hypothetical protein
MQRNPREVQVDEGRNIPIHTFDMVQGKNHVGYISYGSFILFCMVLHFSPFFYYFHKEEEKIETNLPRYSMSIERNGPQTKQTHAHGMGQH